MVNHPATTEVSSRSPTGSSLTRRVQITILEAAETSAEGCASVGSLQRRCPTTSIVLGHSAGADAGVDTAETEKIHRVVPVGNPPVMSVEPRLSARITPRATTISPIPFDVSVHNCFISVHPLPCPFPAPPGLTLHCSRCDWPARKRHRSCRAAPPPRSAWQRSPPHRSAQSPHG